MSQNPAIQLSDLTFTFAEADSPLLSRVNLEYLPGEFALICGPTGSGKSTLLKTMNGLVPHFTAGSIQGKLEIFGQNYLGKKPHEFAPLVGFVNQHAENAFVADRVDEEIAFGLEQLGFSADEMNHRIKSVAKLMGLSSVVCENLTELSGGQQQRVAIASALAVGQKILLLDEPTSELDPTAAHELLLELRRLAREHGITVLVAEHRIERALDLVDSVTVVHGDATVNKAVKKNGFDALLQDYRMVPPAVELGQRLNWSPLPLTVAAASQRFKAQKIRALSPSTVVINDRSAMLEAKNIAVAYGETIAVKDVSLTLRRSTITALVGPNGSGKSSLLWALQGNQQHQGKVLLDGIEVELAKLKPAERLKHLAMVPQNASDLLMHHSISEELIDSDLSANVDTATTSALFAALAGRIDPKRHPRDLSHGQQLALALAIQLAKGARVLLLDEPTRGLDYQAKRQLALQLQTLKATGCAILVASHDVEFVAIVADEIIQLENGCTKTAGTPESVLGAMGELAPQIWQVTGKFLTVDAALAGVS